MVFELLSQSLFDFFRESKFAPFSIRQIQSFAQQIINSIVFLHDLHYIHTDLKPENLMLVNKEKVDVPVTVTLDVGNCRVNTLGYSIRGSLGKCSRTLESF